MRRVEWMAKNLKSTSFILFITYLRMLRINPARECSSILTAAMDLLKPNFWKGYNFEDFAFIQECQTPSSHIKRPIEIMVLSSQLTGRIWRSLQATESDHRISLLSACIWLEFWYLMEHILRQVFGTRMPLKVIFQEEEFSIMDEGGSCSSNKILIGGSKVSTCSWGGQIWGKNGRWTPEVAI